MTKDWYFIIKSKRDGYYGMTALFKGKVSAENKKEARHIIETEYDHKFPLRDSKNNKSCYILGLYEMGNDPQYSFVAEQFKVKKCKQCGEEYTIIDKFNFGVNATLEFCSNECRIAYREENKTYNVDNFDFSNPVIYKITQKTTGKCYIGQTTRSFTLRWWEHIKSSDGNKFHSEMQETDITDWTFEVIEVCKDKDVLDKRESHWINFYNSVEDGFNSTKGVSSVITEEDR